MALQHTGLVPASSARTDGRFADRRFLPVRLANRVGRLSNRRKFKADVLVCSNPDFGRRTETRLLIRTLLGLTEMGATVLCLLPLKAPREAIDAALVSVGRRDQVQFVDPGGLRNRAASAIRRGMSLARGEAALAQVSRLLHPLGLAPSPEAPHWFQMIARHVEDWTELEDSLEFNAVVARCHWLPLCSAVCRTALDRNLPVIAFQQGVIGHSLDAPVTATKVVTFGQSSASFLGSLDTAFYEAAKMTQPPVEYVSGGCLVDEVPDLPNQFARRTLLIVDIPTGHSDFYGVGDQSRALLNLAQRLLEASSSLQRVIIRPHPYWSDLDFNACQQLALQHPTRCEISHPSWALEDDLRRSSAVIGIFSGVVTVASACGLPSFFLQTQDGYSTGDLAAFSPEQTLMPDCAYTQVLRLMDDAVAYEEARAMALQNARKYYAGGTKLELTGSFFDRLLKPRSERLKKALP